MEVVAIVIGLVIIAILGYFLLNQYIKNDKEIQDNKNKNELYDLYLKVNPIEINQFIDDKIKEYINIWVLKNITTNNINYIKSEEINKMISQVTHRFVLEMSDLYLFYVKCLTGVNNDEDLIKFSREKVKMLVLEFVTDFNATE